MAELPPASQGDIEIVKSQDETTEAINYNTAAFKALERKMFQGLGSVSLGIDKLKDVATLNFDFSKEKAAEDAAGEGFAIESEREGRRMLKDSFTAIGEKLSEIGKSFKEGVADKFKSAGGGIFGTITKVLKTLLIGVGLFALFKAIESWANGDFKGFSTAWEKIKTLFTDKIMPMLNKIYDDVLLPLIGFFTDTMLPILTDMFGGIIDSFMANIDFVIQGFQDIFGDGEGGIIGGIGKIIRGIGGFLFGVVDQVLTAIFRLFGADFGESGTLFGAIGDFFMGIYNGVINFFTVTIPNAIASSLDFLGRMTDKVIGFFGEVWNGITTFFSEAMVAIDEMFAEFAFYQFLKQTFGEIFDSIKAIFGGDFSLENFTNLFGGLFDIVTANINLAVNAIRDLFGWGDPEEPFRLSDFILESIQGIIDYFRDIIPTFEELKEMLPSPSSILSSITGGLFGGDDDDKQSLQAELDEIYEKQANARKLGLSESEKQGLKQREMEIKREMRGDVEGRPGASGGLSGAEIDARSSAEADRRGGGSVADNSTTVAVNNNTQNSQQSTTVTPAKSNRRTRRSEVRGGATEYKGNNPAILAF